jgi:hypothetical protein
VAEIHRLRERGKALERLREIRRQAHTAFAIHYSCESFYDIVDGRTPRITSIAVRSLSSGQTHSFSIHKVGEQQGIGLANIPAQYDELERRMLDEFFAFLRGRPGYVYVHWNMRDINYGFPAIEHRYKVLEGDPYIVPEGDKVDLARALVSIYSRSYVGHGADGRFLGICRLNRITDKDALTGKEEAEAFEQQQYVRLHQSTLRKVDMLSNVFERTEDGTLKTNARWSEIYGITPSTVVSLVKEHWFYSLIGIGVTISGVIAKLWGWL